MAKSITTVCIDTDLKIKIQALGYNLSGIINDVLIGIIGQYDKGEADIFALIKRIKDIDTQIGDLQIEKRQLLAQKAAIEVNISQERLKERERKEKMVDAIQNSGILRGID